MPISENETLFQLIGTTYGGDGQSTFALPDLRGRLPLHQSSSFILAESGGAESVTLTIQQIPVHTHPLLGTGNLATGNAPANNAYASSTGATIFPFGTDQPTTTLHSSSIGADGGSQPHDNFQPYLCMNYILSLFGVFPSPT